MKSSNSHSMVLGLALALSAINIGLFVIGIRWAHEFMSELSASSEDESVLGAAEKVGQAYTTVMSAIQVGTVGKSLRVFR